jgi:uncharacterized protein YhhL (DUF1145 family)
MNCSCSFAYNLPNVKYHLQETNVEISSKNNNVPHATNIPENAFIWVFQIQESSTETRYFSNYFTINHIQLFKLLTFCIWVIFFRIMVEPFGDSVHWFLQTYFTMKNFIISDLMFQSSSINARLLKGNAVMNLWLLAKRGRVKYCNLNKKAFNNC